MTTDRRPDPSLSSANTGGAYVGTRGMEGEAPRPFTVDTNAEEAYWRENYASRPYTREGRSFLEYKPAYKYGADAHGRYPGRSFDDVEGELRDDWDRFKGTSSLAWDEARDAARDAWQRLKDLMERALPGDADRDGK